MPEHPTTESPTRWLDDDEMRSWRAFIAAINLVSRLLDRDLRQAVGITTDDYAVLVHLSDAPDHRTRLGQLAAVLRVPKAHLTYRIQRMEREGLIRRVECEDDGRGVWAELTDHGFRQLEHAAPFHVAAVRRHLLDHLSPQQLAAVGDAMAAVLAGHDSMRAGACGGSATDESPGTCDSTDDAT